MSKLYEIDQQIEDILENSVDYETGEILPEALGQLEALQMEREQKIENVALWHKNLHAEAKAITDEIKVLQERKKSLESKMDWQDEWLEYALDGRKFETPKVAISFRKSTTVMVDDEQAFCEKYSQNQELVTTRIERKPNKAEIKRLLKEGADIDGVSLVEKQNIQIK